MTPTELERLMAVEVKMDAVDARTERMEALLLMVVEKKADKSDVHHLAEAVECKADSETVTELAKVVTAHQTSLDKGKGALIILGLFSPLLTGIIVAFFSKWLG